MKEARIATGYLFLFPYLLLFSVFLLFPLFYGLRLSFTNYELVSPEAVTGLGPKFIGAANYREALHDANFWLAIRATSIFVFVPFSGPVSSRTCTCAQRTEMPGALPVPWQVKVCTDRTLAVTYVVPGAAKTPAGTSTPPVVLLGHSATPASTNAATTGTKAAVRATIARRRRRFSAAVSRRRRTGGVTAC